MTQKEFEERTGLKIKAGDYSEIEEMYMNTELDKDKFCELWVNDPTLLKEIERKTVLVRELYEERKKYFKLSYRSSREMERIRPERKGNIHDRR